ncbi:helix-turn-helix transcriptional regulator [Paenibacillus sp. MBLB4367]|uniref:helix-turn-helix transcriptional regulator n=1 Tax=Paenibacillus sp. MBLB4367 TaxID=3384767 RepID=UPI0039083D05
MGYLEKMSGAGRVMESLTEMADSQQVPSSNPNEQSSGMRNELFRRTFQSEEVSSACEKIAHEFQLTLREFELLFHLSLYGFSNKELASVLVISEKTVKNHIANVQRKTNTKSTRELMSLVINRK